MAPSRKSGAPRRSYQPVQGAERIALLASPVRQDLVDTLSRWAHYTEVDTGTARTA